MNERPKGAGGRPRGVRYTRELHAYVEEEDQARVDALAEKWRCSRSAAIRRAIEEAAKRERVEGGE